jgi:hypothetical protein
MKIIVALKEPLWRRLLRYGLWIAILVAISVGVYFASTTARDWYAQTQKVKQIQSYEVFQPQKALSKATQLARIAPSAAHRTLLARVAFEAGEYDLAQQTLNLLPSGKSVEILALRAATAARLNSPDFETFAQELKKAAPAADSERYWGAWGCLASESEDLRPVATRFLARLDSPHYKNRAALLRLQIAILDNEHDEAIARARALLDKPLPPTEAVELMIVAQWLDLPEEPAYRASLQKRAAAEPDLAAALNAIK